MATARKQLIFALLATCIVLGGCQAVPPAMTQAQTEPPTGTPARPAETRTPPAAPSSAAIPTATAPAPTAPVADVISVDAGGRPGAYTFSVRIQSPDRGCEQYADWWEVVSAEGTLLYRRILLHSHVDEQPFVRSGGPVDVAPGTTVWVRAHMTPGGYGGQAFTGSVEAGFSPAHTPTGFAEELAGQAPLPDGCAF